MAIADLALQHVEELDPGMLEDREDVGILGQRDEIGLDRQALAQRVAEQLVLVAGAGAAALDREPLPGPHEGGVALLLVFAEEGGDRDMQRPRQRLQGRQRGRGHAVLDLRQHAGRHCGRLCELADGEPEFLAITPDLPSDRLFEKLAVGSK